MTKPTLNKQTMIQHLVVKQGIDQAKAGELVDFFTDLIRDTLENEGKVVFMNIGTLSMKVLNARVMKSFGEKKKVPSRYKLKFTQSRSFVTKKSPLTELGAEDMLSSLAKISFLGD